MMVMITIMKIFQKKVELQKFEYAVFAQKSISTLHVKFWDQTSTYKQSYQFSYFHVYVKQKLTTDIVVESSWLINPPFFDWLKTMKIHLKISTVHANVLKTRNKTNLGEAQKTSL